MESNLKIYPTISEESDSKSYLCIPIPTKPQYIFPKHIFDKRGLDEEREATIYKKLYSDYSLTIRSEIMIRRIIKGCQIPRESESYPLIKLLMEISCEFMFSEIELAMYSIYLNRFIWPELTNFFIASLFAVALAVKHQFSKALEPFLVHFANKIPNFLPFFSSWMNRNDERLRIDFQELNKAFKDLTQAPFDDYFVNFNFYVDSILEMSPASVYEKPVWIEQLFLPNIQCDMISDTFPALARLDSIFDNFPEPPMIIRGFSTTSNTSFSVWPDLNEF